MHIDAETFDSGATFHGVKGLVRVGDKIIAIRRDDHTLKYPLHIDVPGGGREEQESPFETLSREIREVLAITLTHDDIVYSKRYANPPSRDHDTFFMVTRELTLDPHDIVFGEKGLTYHIMTVHDFISSETAVEKQKDRIVTYLRDITEPFKNET